MAKITAPVKGFTGESFGVAFSNGIGETEDRWLIQRFKDFGYTVVDEKKTPDKEVEEEPKKEADVDESEKPKAASGRKGQAAKSKD